MKNWQYVEIVGLSANIIELLKNGEIMTEIANIDVLKTEIEFTSKDLMIQRVTSETYLNEWYANNLFLSVSKELKELKTSKEILEITESLCIDIFEMGYTTEAYEFIQEELGKLKANGG
jgi:hypothetical protein